MKRHALAGAAGGLAMSLATVPVMAETNLLFILDASNSMWGQVDGTAKIDTAKTVFGSLLGEVPAEARMGLMVYGHRSRSDCQDIELVAPLGSPSAQIGQTVQALSPRGKTPIAGSLEQSWQAFSGHEEEGNAVVLISDGIESCEGDPCAVAEQLAKRGVNLRVHVVGFDVDAEARAQLQCIAEKGGGQYFTAESTDGFLQAVTEAVAVAQVETVNPAPEPEPAAEAYFFDDFEGTALADAWSVTAPDDANLTVEAGKLWLVDTTAGPMESDTANDIVKLSGIPLPDGDWTASTVVDFGLQTAREILQFGVYDGPGEFVLAELYTAGDKYYGWKLMLRMRKASSGSESVQETQLAGLSCNVCGADRMFDDFAAQVSQPVELRLIKEGRSLYAMARQSAPDAEWLTTEKVTALRLSGALAINLSEYEDTSGESYAAIEQVKIETPK